MGWLAVAVIWVSGVALVRHFWENISGDGVAGVDLVWFDPQVVDMGGQWILPGQSLTFTAVLHNAGTRELQIDELRFSSNRASGLLNGASSVPLSIAANASVPFEVRITSHPGDWGPLKLRYGIVGRCGSREVTAGGLADVMFVGAINPEPAVVVLGEVHPSDKLQVSAVQLWRPKSINVSSPVRCDVDDPAIVASFSAVPQMEDPTRSGNARVALGTVTIKVDTRLTAPRISSNVFITAGGHQLAIPVLGYTTIPAAKTEGVPLAPRS
jgi:hypothetical protein